MMLILYIILVVFYSVKNSNNHGNETAYLRILTGYFQLMTITQSFELQWESQLYNFLEYVSFISRG